MIRKVTFLIALLSFPFAAQAQNFGIPSAGVLALPSASPRVAALPEPEPPLVRSPEPLPVATNAPSNRPKKQASKPRRYAAAPRPVMEAHPMPAPVSLQPGPYRVPGMTGPVPLPQPVVTSAPAPVYAASAPASENSLSAKIRGLFSRTRTAEAPAQQESASGGFFAPTRRSAYQERGLFSR